MGRVQIALKAAALQISSRVARLAITRVEATGVTTAVTAPVLFAGQRITALPTRQAIAALVAHLIAVVTFVTATSSSAPRQTRRALGMTSSKSEPRVAAQTRAGGAGLRPRKNAKKAPRLWGGTRGHTSNPRPAIHDGARGAPGVSRK